MTSTLRYKPIFCPTTKNRGEELISIMGTRGFRVTREAPHAENGLGAECYVLLSAWRISSAVAHSSPDPEIEWLLSSPQD